jgi:CRP-like cAMP-binding protein
MEQLIHHIVETAVDRIGILQVLSYDERVQLAPLFERKRFLAGTICFQEGATMNLIGIVASGRLEVKKQTEHSGKSMLIAVLDKGAHIGNFSALRRRGSYGTVVALEDTELLTVTLEKLEAFVDEYPHIGVKILKAIAAVDAIRLQKAIDKVVRLS